MSKKVFLHRENVEYDYFTGIYNDWNYLVSLTDKTADAINIIKISDNKVEKMTFDQVILLKLYCEIPIEIKD